MNTFQLKAQIDDHLSIIARELGNSTFTGLLAHLKSHQRYRTYSPLNRLAIMLQRPATSHVMSLTAWKDVGRTLKPGAQPIYILAPVMASRNPEDELSALTQSLPFPVQPATSDRSHGTPVFYKTVKVYAAEDTKGEPFQQGGQTPQRTVSEEGLRQLVSECPYRVEWTESSDIFTDETTIYLPSGQDNQAVETMQLLQGWALKDIQQHNPKLTHELDVLRCEATLVAYATAEVLGLPNLGYTLEQLALLWGNKPKRVKNGLGRVDKSTQRLLDILAPVQGKLTEAAA